MKNVFYFLLIFLVLFLIGQVLGSVFIFGDGYGYYHVGKSIVENGSFVTETTPDYFEYSGHGVSEFDNKFVTQYTVGNGILWLPFLATAHFFDNGTIFNDYYKAFNGHSFADGFAIQIAAIFFLSISILLIYKTLRNLNFGNKISLLSTTFVTLSSFVLGYSLFNGSYSHVYEFFCISLVYYSLTKFGKIFEYRYLLFAGIAAGLLVLVRPADLVLLIPVCFYILKFLKKKAWIYFFVPTAFSAIIFFVYNYVSYGSPFETGYTALGDSGFSLSNLNIFNLLFSDIRGWFVYSPIMLFGVSGLFLYARKTLQGWLLYILPVLFLLGLYNFWTNWWAGDSIGQRFFIVLAPVCAIGIAFILNKIKLNKYLKYNAVMFFALLTFHSLALLLFYRFAPVTTLGKDNNNETVVLESERFSANDLYRYHYNLKKNSGSISAYAENLKSSLTGGRSLLMIELGMTQPILKPEVNNSDLVLHIIPDPTQNKVVTDINFQFISGDGIAKYTILGIDFSKSQILNIKCGGEKCNVENANLIELDSGTELELSQNKTFKLSEGNVTVFVNSNIKLK